MHIVIHTQYYPPEIGAPQARLSMLARGLSRHGFQVTVLTAMPNYPKGRLYPGYGGWLKIEEIENIRVIRTWIYPTKSKSTLLRLINHFSFVFSSFWAGLFHLKSPDIIITESPPLFLGITGYVLSRVKRARWVFNVSDLWPESAVRLGMAHEGPALQVSRWLEKFCYQHAWCVSGQSHEILNDIKARFPATPVFHLSNGADTAVFRPDVPPVRVHDEMPEGRIGLFAGLHGLAQGLDQVLLAADMLRHLENLKIVFIGDGPLKYELTEQARQMKLCNVYFLDSVSHAEIPGLLTGADFCIVPLGMVLPGAVPSKLYEAMSAGRPIVLMAHGEAAKVVRECDCGLVVEPGDVKGLAIAMQFLTENGDARARFGRNGREAALTRFDRHAITEQFANFLLQPAS